jgi:hypothetical protein
MSIEKSATQKSRYIAARTQFQAIAVASAATIGYTAYMAGKTIMLANQLPNTGGADVVFDAGLIIANAGLITGMGLCVKGSYDCYRNARDLLRK